MGNAYNEIAYPSAVYPRTHPDKLAALAILSGMEPVPVECCRVLELACSDGLNLLSMAYQLPESQFVGLDLAELPIARGTEMAAALGLTNLRLEAADVLAVDCASIGEFDYIVAHGFYSWAPEPVRKKILELCGKCLSAQGIAYVSYNAYPGNHIRDITRGMIRYHTAQFSDPQKQIGQARGLMRLVAGAGAADPLFAQIMASEHDRLNDASDGHFRHDDLNPYNQPFYFHEVMAEAERHGLQFLAEAEITDKREREYSPEAQAALAQVDPDDIVAGEQYRDFLGGRSFRRTLLCRQGMALNHALDATRVDRLYLGGEIRPTGVTLGDGAEGGLEIEVFECLGQAKLETNEPAVKAALLRIGQAWPSFIAFPDLLAQVEQDLQETALVDPASLAEAMLEAAIAGGVELHARPPCLACVPGPRPTASALARRQITQNTRICTLLHQTVEIEDSFSRKFVGLLDGTRDRAALRDAALEIAAGATETITEAQIEAVLLRIARLGLLEA